MATLMERQLDPDGGSYLPARWRTSAFACCWAEHDGDRRRRARRRRGVRGRQILEADLVVVAAGIRPERRARRTRPASGSIAASSSTTAWRRRIPTSSPSANASSIEACATGSLRRCSSRARCWRPRSRQQGPDLHGHRSGRQAQDHGRRRVLRRRLERAARRAGALRGSRARHLQEATVRDGKLAGRSSSATRPTAIATWTGCGRAPI